MLREVRKRGVVRVGDGCCGCPDVSLDRFLMLPTASGGGAVEACPAAFRLGGVLCGLARVYGVCCWVGKGSVILAE